MSKDFVNFFRNLCERSDCLIKRKCVVTIAAILCVTIMGGCAKGAQTEVLQPVESLSEQKQSALEESPYQEITISIGADGYQLDGILCLPTSDDIEDVVILVHGSGRSDLNAYNSKAGPNTMFQDIAIGLAEQGIATIRYNKRYFQYPDHAGEEVTIEDESLNDVGSAIAFAKNNEYAQFKRITIVGHSLGGTLAPQIAKDHPAVAAIVSLGGTPRHLADVIFDQNMNYIKRTFNNEDQSLQIRQLEEQLQKTKQLTKGESGISYFGYSSYFWASLNRINVAELVGELDIPILALQGDEDFQITKEADFFVWQEILQNKPNATLISYPNLNHIFMQSNGKTDRSEYTIKGSVDAKVISDMANWILAQTEVRNLN